MKRIYYGQHTLDVSDDFARVFETWIEENVSGVYYSLSSRPIAGGPRPQFYAVPCYLDGGADSTILRLYVGPGVPLAIGEGPAGLDDPAGSFEATAELSGWLEDEE